MCRHFSVVSICLLSFELSAKRQPQVGQVLYPFALFWSSVSFLRWAGGLVGGLAGARATSA